MKPNRLKHSAYILAPKWGRDQDKWTPLLRDANLQAVEEDIPNFPPKSADRISPTAQWTAMASKASYVDNNIFCVRSVVKFADVASTIQ